MSDHYYDTRSKDLDPTPKPRRRWDHFTEDHKKGTVAQALAWCEANGHDPADIMLNSSYVEWGGEETPEEVRSRIRWAEDGRQRHLLAIKEMYTEYETRGLFEATE